MPGVELPEIYWQDLWRVASLTATGANSGYAVGNAADRDLTTSWRSNTRGLNQVQADFPANSIQRADALIIAGHRLNGLACSLVFADSLNMFNSRTQATFTPATTAVILQRFTSDTFATARLNVASFSTGSLAEVAEMFLGQRYQFLKNPVAPFDPDEELVRNVHHEAESGRTASLHRFRKRTISLAFRNVTNSFYAGVNSWWGNHGSQRLPFFWSFRPETEPSRTVYVQADMERLSFPLTPHRRDGTLTFVEEL
jgi:hypothetical protein